MLQVAVVMRFRALQHLAVGTERVAVAVAAAGASGRGSARGRAVSGHVGAEGGHAAHLRDTGGDVAAAVAAARVVAVAVAGLRAAVLRAHRGDERDGMTVTELLLLLLL